MSAVSDVSFPQARLSHHIVRAADPQVLAAFYVENFGLAVLHRQDDDTGTTVWLRGSPQAVILEIQPAADGPRAALDAGDVFWKLGTTWPDVRAKRAALMAAGFVVTEPRQFRDIGYLCHLTDRDGFGLELLQHTFQPALAPPALGACATVPAHITLRVADADASIAFYRERLGMRLLSRQAVAPFGFTLYFLASTDEKPPDSDLDAVANREWLWQRPYTCLELKHTHSAQTPLRAYTDAPHGPWGMGFTVDSRTVDAPVDTVLLDPDRYAVRVRS